MSKVLRLYNSFTRCISDATLANGKAITVRTDGGHSLGSLYICGPTVYSDSHLGHALTYVRADLFRRFMRSLFNVKLITVMNITDIDDKILARALDEGLSTKDSQQPPSDHPFRSISEKYYKLFTDDMNYIRVKPPELSIKVSDQINLIIEYIKKLERSGHAYLASNGDIYFRVASVENYVGRTDSRKLDETNLIESKQDVRDFALWKAAKPSEPVWVYKSDVTGREVPGRPGWHVQCSAISSAIFGDKLDFHYGGKDLIFPHHYNEQACSCAYHNLDTSDSFHVWSKNWLHSGHLVLRDEKMSKSLGNVMSIRNFIGNSSINALRLLCIHSHYRADVDFNDELLQNMKSLDHKISAFSNYLSESLRQMSQADLKCISTEDQQNNNLEAVIQQVNDEIVDGACDDLDLSRGLSAMLNLSKQVYNQNIDDIQPKDLVSIWQLLVDWCTTVGLEYGPTSKGYDEDLIQLVQNFRQTVRMSVIDEMKRRKKSGDSSETEKDPFLESILEKCDGVRAHMDEFGLVIRDKKT